MLTGDDKAIFDILIVCVDERVVYLASKMGVCGKSAGFQGERARGSGAELAPLFAENN